MASENNFLDTPLVVWVETLSTHGKPLLYKDLYDGVFLNDVMYKIDPRPVYQNANRDVEDIEGRLHNWDLLIRNVKAYYVEVLQQLLILKLPNIQLICTEPEKDVSFVELKKALLLILGCAIQCERKEEFIEGIKSLEVDVQHAIVEHIKEITDDTECILPMEPSEQLETYTEKMFNHLTRVLRERDNFAEISNSLAQERDFYQAQVQDAATTTVVTLAPTTSPEKHHLAVELADCKAKIRKLRQELEDKQEVTADLKDEIQEQKTVIENLKKENMSLTQDARSARSLRDELDILREKVGKVNDYESEVTKMKGKLNELEFYKTRVDELREDNAILIDTKSMLQDQLDSCHKRIESVISLENELGKFRQQVSEMVKERDTDRETIQILTEENAHLQYEKKINMNESTNLEKELEAARLRIASGVGGCLSSQMNETTNARILRLELENQQLKAKLEEAKENALIESTTKNLELEKENQRLAKKVEKLQEAARENSHEQIILEQRMEQLAREKEQIEQAFETVKESAERQVRELEQENDNLSQTMEIVRARSEQTNDARLKDLERENKRLHETLSSKNQFLSKIEFENRQLQKSYSKLKQNSDRLVELETENSNLEKENIDLHKNLSTLQLTVEKYEKLEQENSDLDVENRKLQRTVDSLQKTLQRKEHLEQEHINLTVDNQKLQRSLETLKNSTSKIAELENEKDLLNREIVQLKKVQEQQKSQRTKHEQMELDLLDLDNENQRLQKSLEITTNRVHQLEKDNSDLELENEKLQKNIDTLRLSERKLVEYEKGSLELESEISKIQKEKNSLEKEKKRLKQSIELKDTEIDDLTKKCTRIEQEKRQLKQQVDRQKDSTANIMEIEKENKELLQQAHVNKRTIATLREDLVNEKVNSQKLKNEFDKLSHDLERVGINKEKLMMSHNAPGSPGDKDESKYQALESMMEETLKKGMELKEEKIHALESRLEESKSRNIRLQEEMRLLKRECESLKQRYEEESHGSHEDTKRKFHSPSGELFQLKDHLIQVERNNATLMTENKNLKAQTNTLNEQVKKLETMNSSFHYQSSSIQSQINGLQSDKAKLQVENTALQSQCATLQGQVSSLQGQINHIEAEHSHLLSNHDELQNSHEQLVQDHEQLQRFHEQLTTDYESLISEHGSLKSNHKTMKTENKELRDKLNMMLQGKDDVTKMRNQMEHEKDQLRSELHSMGSMQMNYSNLRSDHDTLLDKHEKLCKEYRDLSADHKRLKNEYNNAQLNNSQLKDQLADYKEQVHCLGMDLNNLASKYDALSGMYQKMEDDNKNLLDQIQSLIASNQELLNKILNNKEHFVEEEKSYIEKLGELKRQKERLEEKIMDHYKRQETHKKNRGFGARLARLFASKNSNKNKSRTNLSNLDNSTDNTSVGSTGDDGKSDKRDRRRGSADNLLDTSGKLAKQSKSWAKSTTALNFSTSSNDSSNNAMRGAKSSDNLLDSLHSNGDKESFSSSNSTSRNSTSLLLPGLGRPLNLEDDDGGFNSFSKSGDNEMLTLEEFLSESSKEKKESKAKPQESRVKDNTDTGSDNSDTLYGQRRMQQKQRAPDPPMNLSGRSHLPDVAAVSQIDLNMSRMSHISTGSSGSGHDSRPDSHGNSTPPHGKLPETSTPANQHPNGTQRNSSLEELNQYSPFQISRPSHDFRKNSMGSTPSTASRTLQYSFSNVSPLNSNSGRTPNHNRELPPTPDSGNSPADRLDRLMGMHNSTPPHYDSPSFQNRDSSFGSDSPHSSSQPRPYQSQLHSGVNKIQFRSQTPLSARSNRSQQYTPSQQNGPTNSGSAHRDSLTRHGPSPLTTGGAGRPQSMYMDQNSSNSANVYSSVDDNRTRNSGDYMYSKSSVQMNGPSNAGDYHSSNASSYSHLGSRVERPKSVPPTMFNKPPPQGQDTDANVYSKPVKKMPPVPPPRKTRDASGIVTGRMSLIREPSQTSTPVRPGPSGGRMPAGHGQLPMESMARTQTPTARIMPSTKPNNNNNNPPPQLMTDEPKDPKENALWGIR